jgi:phage gp16-like protein
MQMILVPSPQPIEVIRIRTIGGHRTRSDNAVQSGHVAGTVARMTLYSFRRPAAQGKVAVPFRRRASSTMSAVTMTGNLPARLELVQWLSDS